MLKKYKAVVFDFDDTLVSTMGPKWAHHKATAQRFYNHTITDDDLKKHYGLPYDELVKNIYKVPDTIENIKEKIWEIKDEFPKILKKNAVQLVQSLIQDQKLVGIITATSRRSIDFDLIRLGFPVEEISFVQSSDDTDFHKPDPRVFEPALKILSDHHISKEEWVYIGDAERDYRAAENAGIDFIGVTHGLSTIDDFKSWNVPYVEWLSDLL